jgi:aryl-alcohol dehydrogenase-like predicted oxidoreductase
LSNFILTGASVFANFYLDCDFSNDENSIKKVDEIIDFSLKKGINYYDTAPWYGFSEELLGKTLGKRPRTDYYIATKIGRYSSKNIEEWFDFSYERTLRSVENSIKLLNCDYIDLIQVSFILTISL